MRTEEFKKYLESLESIETQIVYIKYKYSWEENWTYSNEILEVDMNADGYYAWASDWNEGQEDIEILGCIALCDIHVPKFQKDTEVNSMSDSISRQDAINTALEFFVEFLGGAFHEDDQKILMKRMNELPSAESEPDPEWRKKHYEISYNQGFFDACKHYENLTERKKGKWIKQDCGGVEYTAVCSECGYGTFWSDALDFDFCPKCGIKMER